MSFGIRNLIPQGVLRGLTLGIQYFGQYAKSITWAMKTGNLAAMVELVQVGEAFVLETVDEAGVLVPTIVDAILKGSDPWSGSRHAFQQFLADFPEAIGPAAHPIAVVPTPAPVTPAVSVPVNTLPSAPVLTRAVVVPHAVAEGIPNIPPPTVDAAPAAESAAPMLDLPALTDTPIPPPM